MAYRRQSRSGRGSYSRPRSSGYRSRSAVGRRPAGRARRSSGRASGGRQQTVKIVLQTVQAPATSSAFAQQVETKSDRAKY